jgi:hypothetical protein
MYCFKLPHGSRAWKHWLMASGCAVCRTQAMVDMMVRMRVDIGMDESTVTPEISSLLVFDRFVYRTHTQCTIAIVVTDQVYRYHGGGRSLDLVSPLMTQMTYEGLVDETLGIKSSTQQHSSIAILRCAIVPPLTPLPIALLSSIR